MFDSHCHPGKPTSNALVCTASTLDKHLLSYFPYPSLGALPGYNSSLQDLEEWLKISPFIGEIGLDRRFGEKERQLSFFHGALEVASSVSALVTIHQVGYTDEILKAMDDHRGLTYIIHGFTGSLETAKEMEKRGGIISLSPRAEKTRCFKSILSSGIPFLTETDMETGEEEEKALSSWNRTLSLYTGRDIEAQVEEWVKDNIKAKMEDFRKKNINF